MCPNLELMANNLLIVESPAKAKTIEKILGKDFMVKSSFGHVRDLAKADMGIAIDEGYTPNYVVSSDKKKVISELKKLARKKEVWLATDEDREGEAISWHLAEVLKLNPQKTKRIVFHEITSSAIKKAVANPRTVDMNLVNAQQARRILDRLVGFELSPLLWKKVSMRNSLSAGRVQSVAVRLLVERERDIISFEPTSSFRVSALFQTGNGKCKAELNKKFGTLEDAKKFLDSCKDAEFTVDDIQVKPTKRNPPAPFTTSTLQQEASRKLGYSVARTMSVAQRLYESGKITYMRTDSVNLSSLAINTAKAEINARFGEKYSNPKNFKNKKSNTQDAHEAIRPSYINEDKVDAPDDQQRLYELIWKRTMASQMAPAELERTTISISVTGRDEKFQAKGEVIKFDGYLKLYIVSKDDDDAADEDLQGLLPQVSVNQKLNRELISARQHFSKPPFRFTEASLVKQLEELGIGRPSTYAPTINTIQKRGYVVKESREGKERNIETLELSNGSVEQKTIKEGFGAERNKLFPTDLGMVVTDFLVENFPKILDYGFTAGIEKEFDEIALGKKEWVSTVDRFYKPFHETVVRTDETAERAKGERVLGEDPATGKPIAARIGRFGPMVQIGTVDDEEKPRFASLLPNQSIETITLNEALDLFKLPRVLGKSESGEDIKAAIGRYGPYVQLGKTFVSIPKEKSPYTITLEEALVLLKEKMEADSKRIIKSFNDGDLQVLNGRYGPYIKQGRNNYKIPKGTEPADLTLEACLEIIEKAPPKRRRGRKKS